jgi:hypothetical protein
MASTSAVSPTVTIGITLDARKSSSKEIHQFNMAISPPNSICKKAKEILETFARDCANELDRRNVKVLTVGFSFSAGRDFRLNSSDPEIVKIFSENVSKYKEIKGKVLHKTEVSCTIAVEDVLGQTTGTLRFPHMLKYFFDYLENQRKADDTKVCIVGPGMWKDCKGVPTSFQFVEVLSLFPNAQFLLLDNDEEALAAMENFFKKHQAAMYDPFTLRARTSPFIPKHTCPESYLETFNAMKEFFIAHAHKQDSNAMEAMLIKHEGDVKKFYVKVPSDKLEIRNFDINSSQFEENESGKFDVIVATMSIVNALYFNTVKWTDSHKIAITVKFLDALKEDGQLIIDKPLYDFLTQDGAMTAISNQVGYELKVREIPLSDFDPNSSGEKPMILSTTTDAIPEQSFYKHSVLFLSCHHARPQEG